MKSHLLLASCLAFVLGSGVACAQDNALVDALVRKKILTPKEAESIRADLVKESVASDKIKISGPVTELALYGDLRLRYQYDNLDPQLNVAGDPGHGTQNSRFRFRLRLNADFKLTDGWFGGVQLTTSQNSDTGSQTFDKGFENYPIFISRAFVGWKNSADWLTVVAGKQPNPFYTTDMTWDPNINPSGLVEQVKFHKLFADRGGEVDGYTKDGKAIVSSKDASFQSPWELTLVAGQFCFDDNPESSLSLNTDAFLFEEQLIVGYKFNKNLKFTIAPAYLAYNAARINDSVNTQPFARSSDGFAVTDGVRETANLSIIQLPGDITFKVAGIQTKFLWDATYNTEGGERTRDVYGINGKTELVANSKGDLVQIRRSNHSSQDDYAYQVGFQVGQNVKKGDCSLLATYRQVGLAAVDPNLNASDWGLSRVNMRGWKFAGAYNLSDSVIFMISYFTGDNVRKDLVGGQATGGAKIADANSDQLLTLDVNVKF
ncbi:MAG: putative porin [Verrucomicrobiota bacterium]